MQLIQNLYNVLTQSNKLYKVIQIIPNDDTNQLILHEEEDVLDIGMSKKTYLAIFKESHTYFHNSYDKSTSNSHDDLQSLYLMTLGFLITTNEHSTIIKLHEKVVNKLNNQEQDLEIISSFLTCKSKRINKSSSLWYYLKKLTISQVYVKKDYKLLNKLVLRALKSCKTHFANYYANNYLRWIIMVNQIMGMSNEFLIQELRRVCHANLSDSSLWGTFCILMKSHNENGIELIVEEYNMMTGISLVTEPSSQSIYQCMIPNEFKWLINVQCKYLTPYRLLIQSCESNDILISLRSKIQDSNLPEDLRQLILNSINRKANSLM
ncbi:uncharacterized protein KGF55_005341 [Candida pseudojiufengensis]|uniref:uncharacterized protein n=1 Tax=Candida pseudojiufengensis TaxID=497109 RepID=UPI0022252ABC|nr:uncharacterized protein KGF55_005341 [Candida pseudojiufengensis]KAI5959513.1 hypothetical protein KGF55_005341 [Candida pseudojiufengensis]